MADFTPLEKLRIADPETFDQFRRQLARTTPPPDAMLEWMVDDIVQALVQEIGYGRAYARGLLLVWSQRPEGIDHYGRLVRDAARTGATLARIMARHAAPVVAAGQRLTEGFLRTVAIMRTKGTYTLSAPLGLLDKLLAAGDHPSAEAYLDLLSVVFAQPLNYNQSLRLTYLLPEAAAAFAAHRRCLHILQAARLARTDPQLLDFFFDGLRKGLKLLPDEALARFVDETIERFGRNAPAARAFISLDSNAGQTRCADLQVAAALSQVEHAITGYVRARLGRSVTVQPMSVLPADQCPQSAMVCSDGRAVYLIDELDHFPGRAENQALYKSLVRLEAGCLEAGTYDFDLERAADRHPEVAALLGPSSRAPSDARCDGERFIQGFACPALADDLFAIMEQGRLMGWMAHTYPGLWHRMRQVLTREAGRCQPSDGQSHPLADIYARQVLSETPGDWHHAMAVEDAAAAVCRNYGRVTAQAHIVPANYRPLPVPFGWRPQWHLVSLQQSGLREKIERLRAAFARQGVQVYRADLRRRIARNGGTLGPEDIRALLQQPRTAPAQAPLDPHGLDLAALLQESGIEPVPAADDRHAWRYPEWDVHLQDYRHDHVALHVKALPEGRSDFYPSVLARHQGLLTHTRRAFELLKPERLKLLRPWREGDDFDYRALLDFAVDRHMGRTPADRLFIKRIKKSRDVAVLVLVDLSRSTANTVPDGSATVLKVAQEALVIFCEALAVVGDTFAIAGFSGSGRHAVEYFGIKAFDEAPGDGVQQRIAALSPQRSTRMGAAIRHATAELARIESRVRLLLLISDGFPNDLDYKADYAVADTRRAIQEARSRTIHVKAITVNIGSDPRLDDLYGRRHHHVIGAVTELPGKLLRLYGTLTRQ